MFSSLHVIVTHNHTYVFLLAGIFGNFSIWLQELVAAMELLANTSGDANGRIWIENHPSEGWAPGRVDSLADGGTYIVVDEQGQQFNVPQNKARPVDPNCLQGVDDLLDLGDFNEGALLHDIRVRYFQDEIYTGIGNPILISVNPYQALPCLYTEAKQKYYRNQGAAISQGANTKIAPHLFSVAAASYMSMLGDSKNQSIIISGESGAGKTEATKRILTYFANLQTGQTTHSTSNGQMSIEDQVLKSNPILEAFGNAKTIRNDNSSRFGKFIEIEFDRAGKLRSARISNYLLEKSRIVTQQPEERGYHAFYQLCAGADSPEISSSLGLRDASDHAYTCCCTTIDGVDDRKEFDEMAECMHSLGFADEERDSVFRLLAAVLHLGDLEFEEHGKDGGCIISDSGLGEQVGQLLNVDIQGLNKVFQYKTFPDPINAGNFIDMPQDVAGASNTRHSMAKVLYSRLFDWLVWRINKATASKTASAQSLMIGILDIYGFEVFEWNSFEQLCINFANEKLQQHFNAHMFTLEQRLYSEEGISWSHIQWQDNREIIAALDAKPLGLFCILDSECLMPSATDTTCLGKIYAAFKTSKIVTKPSRFASTTFAVAHYAGDVVYDVVSFLEKNTDKLHADIIRLLKTSEMPLLRTLFTDPRFASELNADSGEKSAGAAAGGRGRGRAPLRGSAAAGKEQRAKQNVTVSMNFRAQLDRLVEDLNKTHPRYIRCIKPNGHKQPHEFDSLDVLRQLRCAGMLECIRIRKAGYSVRQPFKEFFNRFRVVCPHLSTEGRKEPDYKDLCFKLLTEMQAKSKETGAVIEDKSWQIGRSKVFLREDLKSTLEKHIGLAIQCYIECMQARWRGYRERKRYRALKEAGILMQASLRMSKAANSYKVALQRHHASVSLQALMRACVSHSLLVRKRKSATYIQAIYRGWRCRQRMGKLKGKMAAERLQRMREEEERKEALAAAQRAAEERERALIEMQRQLEAERERSQKEELERQCKLQEEEREKERIRQETEKERERIHQEEERERQRLEHEAELERQRIEREMQLERQRVEAAEAEARKQAKIEEERQLHAEEVACLREEVEKARKMTSRLKAEIEQEKSSKTLEECKSQKLEEESRKMREQHAEEVNSLKQSVGKLQFIKERLENDLEEAAAHGSQNIQAEEELARHQQDKSRLKALTIKLQQDAVNLREDKGRLQAELDKQTEAMQHQAAKLSQASVADLSDLRNRLQSAEERFSRMQVQATNSETALLAVEGERLMLQRRVQDLQQKATDASSLERTYKFELTEQKQKKEVAERVRDELEVSRKHLECRLEHVTSELKQANTERTEIKKQVDELIQMEDEGTVEQMKQEVETWKRRADYFEKEYKKAKQLNSEMTKVMTQMTQTVSERSDETGKQARALAKQLEAKNAELATVKGERDEVRSQLDNLQSTGTYYQDKFKEATAELRALRHEHAVSTATSNRLSLRVEALQREAEDAKAKYAQAVAEVRASFNDSRRVQSYEREVQDLQQTLVLKDALVWNSPDSKGKTKALDDSLKAVSHVFDMAAPLRDETVRSQLEAKKNKAEAVLGRLNVIASEEERPSIPVRLGYN